jgi:hypothetical protein
MLPDGHVPGEPGVRAVVGQHFFLRSIKIETIARHSNIIAIRKEGRRFRLAVNGGVSTPLF